MSASKWHDEVIWATRGRTWGFRFLLTGGRAEPLTAFERAFHTVAADLDVIDTSGPVTALRLADPLGRRDSSGRTIPHEFVLSGAMRTAIRTLDDAVGTLWPLVAEVYDAIWEVATPPSARTLPWPRKDN